MQGRLGLGSEQVALKTMSDKDVLLTLPEQNQMNNP
jgi:hypothetical protein